MNVLKVLKGQKTSHPPIWLMRQAGRYMPEYRAIRQRHPFLEMCHQPELIASVTQLPIDAFGMDVAILFSDILLILETLGIPVRFEDGIGPIIDPSIKTEQEIDSLKMSNPREVLGCVAEGIKLLKTKLKVPLIGFCGGPFTVASYAIEGKSSKDLKLTKQWLFRNPQAFHRLLNKIANQSLEYLKMQVEAGVDAIQIFDSWAHVLSYDQFHEVSQRYLKKLVDGLRPYKVPVILFCRGTSGFISPLVELAPQAISLDWNCDIGQMRKQVPENIAMQGNLDPYVLYAPREIIRKEAKRIVEAMRETPFIFNLGHGILPDVPTDAVKVLMECVKE